MGPNKITQNSLNSKMDMQKIVTLDGFGVCADLSEHFVKYATLNKKRLQDCVPDF